IAQSVDCLGRLFQSEDIQNAEAIFKAKVLVVDDDPICTFATTAAMKRAKLEAVSSLDPVAALQMAQQDQYDIVLLDINMPGLNGFEVCEKLRLLPRYQDTPVIFVTSNSEFQNRAQAVLSGGDDLIAKPISPLELALKTIIHLVEPKAQPHSTEPKAEIEAAPVIQPVQPVAVEPARIRTPESAAPLPIRPTVADTEHERSRPLMMPTAIPRPVPPAPAIPSLQKTIPALEMSAAESPMDSNANGMEIDPPVKNRTEQVTLDKLAREVAGIMFGDERVSETSLRLTRVALDRCNVLELMRQPGGAKKHPFDRAAREISRIVFGDENVSEAHLRLIRIALEHFDVPPVVSASAEIIGRNVPRTATGLTA
ncbi:MAG TPA: response regulator, partial [Candidatus Baltobacteraceae bacterium]|nr:response regulator [Candidatus Baltobacteraceae bacterium]